jgi:hypothetical protein
MKQYRFVLAIGLLLALLFRVPAYAQEEQPAPPTDSKTAMIINVKVGSAKETARILDELFNGSGTDHKDRIVVLAIPLTSCLLVKATSADLQEIRHLLRT